MVNNGNMINQNKPDNSADQKASPSVPDKDAERGKAPSDSEKLWNTLDPEIRSACLRLTDCILEWNEKINVTAIRDREAFLDKNVLDSLTLCGRPELGSAKRILDMGTGGGFPGLPLAIANPEKEFYLVDSIGKKIKVVSAAAEELGLKNVKAFQARAEELGRDPAYRESFDLVVSRAVANMSSLAEFCLPFVKPGGFFVAYKTTAASDEIAAAAKAIGILGGSPVVIVPDGRENSDHVFAVVKKASSTPAKYPRSGGAPLKKPL